MTVSVLFAVVLVLLQIISFEIMEKKVNELATAKGDVIHTSLFYEVRSNGAAVTSVPHYLNHVYKGIFFFLLAQSATFMKGTGLLFWAGV